MYHFGTVFIGGGESPMNQKKIEELLDTALLDGREWVKWQKVRPFLLDYFSVLTPWLVDYEVEEVDR